MYPCFSPSIYDLCTLCLGHKSMGKNANCNLRPLNLVSKRYIEQISVGKIKDAFHWIVTNFIQLLMLSILCTTRTRFLAFPSCTKANNKCSQLHSTRTQMYQCYIKFILGLLSIKERYGNSRKFQVHVRVKVI